MRTLLAVMLLVVIGCSGSQPEAEPVENLSAPVSPAATPTETAVATPPKTTVPAAPPPPDKPAVDAEGLAVVREYTRMFHGGELDLLHQKFSDEMRGVLSMEQLSALYEQVITDYGKETRLIAEDSQRNEEYRAFVRWAHYEKTDEIIEVQWILRTSDDEIAGFFVRPAKRKIKAEGR